MSEKKLPQICVGLILILFLSINSLFAAFSKDVAEAKQLEKRLRFLHKPVPEPGPSDWLACHKENGQSFGQYLLVGPRVPTKKRNILYVQPLADMSDMHKKIVRICNEYLSIYFNIKTVINEKKELLNIPDKYRRINPYTEELQFHTWYLNNKILLPALEKDAFARIGITNVDLWPGKNWNYVFGEAYLQKRIGVWSLKRLGNPDESKSSYLKCLIRTMKLATHEVGHMFTLFHCIKYSCNMNGSNNLAETDRQPLYLCPACLAKICHATGVNPLMRYKKLLKFYKKYNINSPQEMTKKSLAVLNKLAQSQKDINKNSASY